MTHKFSFPSHTAGMRLNCGDVCPRTGAYKVIDGEGRLLNTIYVGEGESMPPTQDTNCHYELE